MAFSDDTVHIGMAVVLQWTLNYNDSVAAFLTPWNTFHYHKLLSNPKSTSSASSLSSNQEIPTFYKRRKFHCRLHKKTVMLPVVTKVSPTFSQPLFQASASLKPHRLLLNSSSLITVITFHSHSWKSVHQ